MRDSGSKKGSEIDRCRSPGYFGLPCHLIPTFRPGTEVSSRFQCSARSGSGKMYGTSAGIASTEVAVKPGTFMSVH
jgi:hypothetical protein